MCIDFWPSMEQESNTSAKLDCQFGVWLSLAWFWFFFLFFFFSSYHNGCCYQFLSLHRCYSIAFSWRVLEIKSKMLAKWQFANNSSTKKCRKWSLFFMVLFSSLVAYLLAHVSSSTRNWNFVCSTIKWKHRHHFTRVIWQISSSSSRNSKRIGVTLIALDRKAASEWALLKICWTWVVEMIVVWIWKAMKWYGECVCVCVLFWILKKTQKPFGTHEYEAHQCSCCCCCCCC